MTQEKYPNDKITTHERVVVRKISSDGSDAIRVVGDQQQSVTADLNSEGGARYEVTGGSRQNEEGVLEVCRILAQRLRRDNVGWASLDGRRDGREASTAKSQFTMRFLRFRSRGQRRRASGRH